MNVADVDLLGETAQPIVRLKLLFLIFDPGVDAPQDARVGEFLATLFQSLDFGFDDRYFSW